MEPCRVCLTSSAEKDIFNLKNVKNDSEKSFVDVFKFCLGIQVVQDAKISTKLCLKCYKKILSFHKFKCLAIKNDAHLKTLQEIDVKSETLLEEVKTEQLSMSDESQEASVKLTNDCDVYLKNEDTKLDSDTEDEFLIELKSIKYEEFVKDAAEENEREPPKQRKRRTKIVNTIGSGIIKQVCEECGKSVKDLKAHSFRHLPMACRKRIKCKFCDKLFSSHSARYKHNKIKHLGIKHKCTLCNKVVKHISQHERLVHNRGSLPFECVPCGRRFLSQSSRDMHMTTHTKDRPHACPECDKKFSTKGLVAIHKRQVHDKEKSHLCQLCSKSFFKKYHLQVHLRSHSKEKPYECPDCGKCFSSCTIMKSHRVIHDDTKNFACSLCEMTFKKRNYLNVHMISHTKEKRHPCQYCGVRFGRSDHRKRHERTAHEKHLATS